MRAFKRFIWLALAACLVSSVFRGCKGTDEKDDVDESDVVVLNSSNIDTFMQQHDGVLLEIYAPWCAHCKTLKPEYAAAATALKELHPGIIVAKLDGDAEPQLAERFGAEGFPTLIWVHKGKEEASYTGEPTKDGIVQWVDRLAGGAAKAVSTTAEVADAKKRKLLMLGYFDKFDGEAHEAFNKLALDMEDVTFLKTNASAAAKELGINKAPGFALVRNHAGHPSVEVLFDGHAAAKAEGTLAERLENFLFEEKLPDYLTYDMDKLEDLQAAAVSVPIGYHLYVVHPPEASHIVDAVRAAGQRLRGQALLFSAPLKTSLKDSPLVSTFEIDVTDAERVHVAGAHTTTVRKYRCALKDAKAPTADELVACGRSIIDNTAERIYSSAPVPDEAVEEGVTVLVGSTLGAIAKDPSKDVLVEVYAPWCGACQAFGPTYRRLAAAFENISSIVVAKMDGTVNEHPDLEIEHFPTLAFFPATKDSVPVPVEVDISEGIAPLVKFLEENAKVPFKTPDLARFLEEEKAEGVELEDEYADGEDEGSVSGSGVKGENILPLHEEL